MFYLSSLWLFTSSSTSNILFSHSYCFKGFVMFILISSKFLLCKIYLISTIVIYRSLHASCSDRLRNHKEIFDQLNKTRQILPILNDITFLISKSTGVQMIVLSLQYLCIAIFSVFGILKFNSEDPSFRLFVYWQFYFAILTHTLIVLVCINNFLIQCSVSFNLFLRMFLS